MGSFAAILTAFALNIFSLICKIIVNWVCVSETFYLTKTKVRAGRMLFGLLLMSAAELTPLFIAAIFYPDTDMNAVVYCLLVFPNPLFLFLYRFIYRNIFQCHSGASLMSLEWLMNTRYISLLVYAFFNILWAGILNDNLLWNSAFVPDFLGLVSATLVAILTYRIFIKIVNTTKHYFILPHDYMPKSIDKSLLGNFLSILYTYILLVSVRLLFIPGEQYRPSFSINALAVFFVLILLQCYRAVDQYQKTRNTMYEYQAKQASEYIETLLHTTSEFRQIKHDFYNVLQTYEGYFDLGDMDGLRRYHNSLLNVTVDAGENLSMLEALHARAPIYSLFKIKKDLAEHNGVLLMIQGADNMANIGMNDLDLCRILSNLLDNAIQAAMESDRKEVLISGRQEENTVILQIKNYTAHSVDVEQIFNEGYTTKFSHSGHGLMSVKRIMDSYNGYSIDVQCTDNVFVVSLHLGVL